MHAKQPGTAMSATEGRERLTSNVHQFQGTCSQGNNSASCAHNNSLESLNVWTPLCHAVFPVKLPFCTKNLLRAYHIRFTFTARTINWLHSLFFPHTEFVHHVERINSKWDGKESGTEPHAAGGMDRPIPWCAHLMLMPQEKQTCLGLIDAGEGWRGRLWSPWKSTGQ